MRREPRALLEDAAEVEGAEANDVGQLAQRQVSAQAVVDQLKSGTQLVARESGTGRPEIDFVP